MYRKRTFGITAFVCLLLVILVFFLLHHGAKAPAEQPRAAAIVDVTRGTLASSLTVAGQFQPYQEVDLHAQVSG